MRRIFIPRGCPRLLRGSRGPSNPSFADARIMRILVTGSAGFIGFHMARRLLDEGHEVVGLDGFTPYYDRNLKLRGHEILLQRPVFSGHEAMLEDCAVVAGIYGPGFDAVYHFAAQAGVRY